VHVEWLLTYENLMLATGSIFETDWKFYFCNLRQNWLCKMVFYVPSGIKSGLAAKAQKKLIVRITFEGPVSVFVSDIENLSFYL
jgi:hypothetical protein